MHFDSKLKNMLVRSQSRQAAKKNITSLSCLGMLKNITFIRLLVVFIRLLVVYYSVLITQAIPASESILTKEAYMSVKFHAFWIHQMCAFSWWRLL